MASFELEMDSKDAPPTSPQILDTSYHHRPLDQSQRQIRLLKFDSSSATTQQYHLEHFTFDAKGEFPPYLALSYVWGAESPTNQIQIDGQAYTVRSNLYHFLRQDLCKWGINHIWIDQICIDQTSVLERNHQIGIMSLIFKLAGSVIIWLGEHDEEVVPGFRCFAELQTPMYCDLSPFLDLPQFVTPGKANIAHWVMNKGEPKLKPEVVRAVNKIYSNRFWTRLWIVQEVFLGRTVAVMQGSLTFHLAAISLFERYGLRPRAGGMIGCPEVAISCRQDRPAWSRPRDLLWMVDEYCDFGCQDPRDKVYGLLGIIETGYGVSVDYRKTPEEVYVDFIFTALAMREQTSYQDSEKERKASQSLIETLYRLATNMIPDKKDKYFEAKDDLGFRFRGEHLREWWKLTDAGKAAS